MSLLSGKAKLSLGARAIVAAIVGLCSSAAVAFDWMSEAHPVTIESSYIGSSPLNFTIDQTPSSSCPAGAWLHWNTRGTDEAQQIANVQAVLSVLMTAKLSGKRVRVFGNNSDCGVDFIHLID